MAALKTRTVKTRIVMLALASIASLTAPAASFADTAATVQAAAPRDEVPRPQDLVVGSWELYKTRFLEADGRIVDDANGNVSHSEGQGYGLLIAVAANDRPAFDRILGWTERNLMVRPDGLAAWKWDPAAKPHVADTNNASDGDLLIAWALTRAARQWGDLALRDKARRIVETLARAAVIDTDYGKVLLPGAAGFGEDEQPDGPVVNLSYWVFPALEETAALSSKFPAHDLIESGLALLRATAATGSGLAPDWTSLAGDRPKSASAFEAVSGYNAVRVPLYVAWFSAGYRTVLAPYRADAEGRVAGLNPGAEGVRTPPTMSGTGYRAISELVACSLGERSDAPTALQFRLADYYSSTLHILSQMALVERYPQCVSTLPSR